MNAPQNMRLVTKDEFFAAVESNGRRDPMPTRELDYGNGTLWRCLKDRDAVFGWTWTDPFCKEPHKYALV